MIYPSEERYLLPEGVVYFGLPEEEMQSAQKKGFGALGSELTEDNIDTHLEVDSYRPQWVIDRGVSVLGSVIARPAPFSFNGHFTGAKSRDYNQRYQVSEIEVDSSAVVVADGYTRDKAVISAGECKQATGSIAIDPEDDDWGHVAQYSKQYWDEALSLGDFLRTFDILKDKKLGSYRYVRQEGAARGSIPWQFLDPEVLVPGPIEAVRLHHVATSIWKIADRTVGMNVMPVSDIRG